MQIANGADTVQSILESCKCRRLREKHEKSIETLVEVGVLLRLKELEAKICKEVSVIVDCGGQVRMKDLQVKTGDSRS